MESIQKNRVYIKDLRGSVGKDCCVYGWVDVRRDHGKLVFLDIRDESGVVQAVVSPKSENAYEVAREVRSEWVVKIIGVAQERPDSMKNPDADNGDIEMSVENIEVLNPSETPPFPLDTDGSEIGEEIRLQYRYLDLRRKRLQRNIRLRSKFVQAIRAFLFENNFVEIETPLLTQATPEGARDFIVPSRLHQGSFFALPQSPQQYKQLLMVGGFEKYFQIARCLRDEDLRADRAFEHTQIDMEMSFVSEEDVRSFDEAMITAVYEEMGCTIKQKPFPVFSYAQAMEQFGADKFDLRTQEEKDNGVLAFAWVVDFPFFEKNKQGEWTFTHNPFSMPKQEHLEDLKQQKNLENIISHQYDLVCNGYEIGSGSVRTHDPEILKQVFTILGYNEEQIQQEFQHILTAFSFGAPPHGGIAHGVERLLMLVAQEEFLREVQAFPQTSSGQTAVMSAPSRLPNQQLQELSIAVTKQDDKTPRQP